MEVKSQMLKCFQMWIMTSPGTGGFIRTVEKQDQLLLPLGPPDLCFVLFRSDTYTHSHSLRPMQFL